MDRKRGRENKQGRKGRGGRRPLKSAPKGWRVKRERPEDSEEAEAFYGEQGAEVYEKNVMKKIQERILARALLLAEIPEGAKVLDAGCGTGFGMEVLKQLGYSVKGFDISRAMVEKTKKKGFGVKKGDLRDIPFPEGEFDAIVSISALQWVPLKEREKVAQEFWRVLRQEGGKGKAVIQYYPKSEEEMMQTGHLFKRQGFRVKLQIDNEENARKRKIFMLLEK